MFTLLRSFVATTLFFLLFYFNTPYLTGSRMAELSKSGIWRYFFRLLSNIGYGLFRLTETLFRRIPLVGRCKRKSISYFFNLLMYILILYGLSSLYSFTTNFFFAPEIIGLYGTPDNIWDWFRKSVLIYHILVSGSSLLNILGSFADYIIVNTVFFSILFGFLQNKVIPKDLGKSISVPENSSFFSVLLKAAKDFLSNLSIVDNLKTRTTWILLFLGIIIYSFLNMLIASKPLTIIDVFLELISRLNILPIAISFGITALAGKSAEKVVTVVVSHLPTSYQNTIHTFSASCNKLVQKADEKRKAWAEHNSTTNYKSSDRYTEKEYGNAYAQNTSHADDAPTPAKPVGASKERLYALLDLIDSDEDESFIKDYFESLINYGNTTDTPNKTLDELVCMLTDEAKIKTAIEYLEIYIEQKTQ